jgi:predicted transcriptional regulator
MPTSGPDNVDFIALSAEVVAAYVMNNSVPVAELPALLSSVHAAFVGIAAGTSNPASQTSVALSPAVSVRRSVTPDYLICLDDGRKFKSLKRHIGQLGMTPDQYRAKWNLPSDYPMVAPNYAATRSALAKKIGLGQQRRKTAKS